MSSWHIDDAMSRSRIVLWKVAVESVSMSSWHIDEFVTYRWCNEQITYSAMESGCRADFWELVTGRVSRKGRIFQKSALYWISQKSAFFEISCPSWLLRNSIEKSREIQLLRNSQRFVLEEFKIELISEKFYQGEADRHICVVSSNNTDLFLRRWK